jgi:hypothetical protein
LKKTAPPALRAYRVRPEPRAAKLEIWAVCGDLGGGAIGALRCATTPATAAAIAAGTAAPRARVDGDPVGVDCALLDERGRPRGRPSGGERYKVDRLLREGGVADHLRVLAVRLHVAPEDPFRGTDKPRKRAAVHVEHREPRGARDDVGDAPRRGAQERELAKVVPHGERLDEHGGHVPRRGLRDEGLPVADDVKLVADLALAAHVRAGLKGE